MYEVVGEKPEVDFRDVVTMAITDDVGSWRLGVAVELFVACTE